MSLTHKPLLVKESRRAKQSKEIKFLIDSGAIHSLAQRQDLEQLGIESYKEVKFVLADGTTVECPFGLAVIEFMGAITSGRVIFGPENVRPQLGGIALESVGIVVDPANRKLRRLPAIRLK